MTETGTNAKFRAAWKKLEVAVRKSGNARLVSLFDDDGTRRELVSMMREKHRRILSLRRERAVVEHATEKGLPPMEEVEAAVQALRGSSIGFSTSPLGALSWTTKPDRARRIERMLKKKFGLVASLKPWGDKVTVSVEAGPAVYIYERVGAAPLPVKLETASITAVLANDVEAAGLTEIDHTSTSNIYEGTPGQWEQLRRDFTTMRDMATGSEKSTLTKILKLRALRPRPDVPDSALRQDPDPSTEEMPDTPKTLELFAGAGGMAYGLRLAGFEALALIEYIPAKKGQKKIQWSAKTLKRMVDLGALHGKVVNADVANVDFSKWKGQVDVLVGGPPCQPYSKASKLPLGNRDARDGWPHMMRALVQTRPKYLIAENVANMLAPKFQNTRDAIENRLLEQGYHWTWQKVLASHVGVAQKRERVFLMAWREGQPPPRPLDTSAPPVSVGDLYQAQVLDELDDPAPSGLTEKWQKKHPVLDPSGPGVSPTVLAHHAGGNVHLVDVKNIRVGDRVEHVEASLSEDRSIWGTVIDDVGDNLAVETAWKIVDHGFDDGTVVRRNQDPFQVWRRKDVRALSPKKRVIKRASPAMRTAWQSFPPQWDFQGGKIAKDRQIGNAVPPFLAMEIGRTIHPDPPPRHELTPGEYYAYTLEGADGLDDYLTNMYRYDNETFRRRPILPKLLDL